jgi:hypothetical protein
VRRACIVLMAALIALLAQPISASAHTPEILYGPNSSTGPNWATVSSDHKTVEVHDGHCGGTLHVARIQYHRIDTTGITRWIYDDNGCASGNGIFTVPSSTVKDFQLCVGDHDGPPWGDPEDTWCTGWRTA